MEALRRSSALAVPVVRRVSRLKPLRLSLVPPNPPDGPEAINGRILNRQLSMHLMRAAFSARKPSSPENCPVFARNSGIFLPTRALRKKARTQASHI
ncbi:hypothetical protein GL4_1521 [Methyloceanibacter caenitepidi]|uniref:Uncharacterized protein n=1 Tax=Methyloceanibacter caenitepidi TaxID=1384459 RepID=A0A0A8K365_9HYPH|nr:hypothetical protein GL4_1521 [Methyloceanibacter caenitepidi]